MKKMIGMLSVFLLPVVSFAQHFGESGRFQYNYTEMSPWVLAGSIFLIMLIPLIWLAIIVFLFVFWLRMLIDAIKKSPADVKLVWVIVIIFTHIIGAVIYYFVEKRPRKEVKKVKVEKIKTETERIV